LFIPNEEELKFLKRYQEKNFDEKVLPMYDNLKKEVSPGCSACAAIEEEERVSRESKKTLDKLLEQDKYRQKAEDLLKKYKNNPPFDNSHGDTESQFDEQIANLQNQIIELENRQNQDSSLETNHKYKQELKRLKKELEVLKRRQKEQPTSKNKKGE
jgi:hypothetical protein